MTKDEIRKKHLVIRNRLRPDDIIEKSKKIAAQACSMSEYKDAENILVFASFGSEVMTDWIIMSSLMDGKNVFCPRIIDSTERIMKFYRIKSMADLKVGYRGIREPMDDPEKIFDESDESLKRSFILLPGVAFDRETDRIGYKGGFYDRYLSDKLEMKRAGLAFTCQITEEKIPTEDTDIKAVKVITEAGIIGLEN